MQGGVNTDLLRMAKEMTTDKTLRDEIEKLMKYLGGWDIMPVDNSLGMEAFEQGIVDVLSLDTVL